MKLKFRTGKRETSEKCWTQIRRASVAVLQRRAATAKSTQRHPHLHRPNIQRNGARPFKIMNRMPPNRRPLHRHHPVQPGTTTSQSSLLRSIIRTKTLIFNQ